MKLALGWMTIAFAFALSPAQAGCAATGAQHATPLVELYTAEGCNECPAADRWLSTLAKRSDPASVVPLAFHVDYWDVIGWPDRFAAPLHGQRQEARVMLAGKRVVYTPQTMVGRETQLDWRDRSRVEKLLRARRAEPARIGLEMEADLSAEGVQVRFRAHARDADALAAQPLLWLALYQDGLVSAVKAGENAGRTLRHDRVVRALHGPWPMKEASHAGTIGIALPAAETGAGPLGLALFAESSLTGEGLQALAMPLADCLR